MATVDPLDFQSITDPTPDDLERLSDAPVKLPLTPDRRCGRCGRVLFQPRAHGKLILHRCWPDDPWAAGTADHEDGIA